MSHHLYTPNKVYLPLTRLLPVGKPHTGDNTRFSVRGDLAGIAAQRAAHNSIYGADPAIQTISTWPDEAWDPAHAEIGEQYGVRWIRMQDLHHKATGSEPIAAVALVDDHLITSITLSSTTRHIVREDGEDENGYTRLMLAILNHYPSLTRIRWADDVTRAGRDAADWAQLKAKCKVRDVRMVLGGQEYDLKQPADEIALGALGLVGGNDDPARRRRLTGKRLMKYKLGGAAISEMQMPHGWHHKKDRHGRPVNEGDRGLVPEAEPAMIPVLRALYGAHAAGETYQQLADRMVAFESDGLLRRRDHTNLDNTYAETVGDPLARYDAAKSFFVRGGFRPRVQPCDLDIARYLAGDDPADVFDADTRLYIAKVELVRTGRYFRRLRNDIRGRNTVLDGIPAIYRDDRDEYGWFDVLAAPWAWPTDAAGQPVPRFGLSDETCRKVAARLLTELREAKAPRGGRAHQQSTRRALQRFDNWLVAPGEPGARYDDEATQWGVEARCNNSGKANFVLLFRRASAGTGTRGGARGWSYFGPGESKPDHIVATGSLGELCASVSVQLDRAVRDLLQHDAAATLSELPPPEPAADPTAAWRHKVATKKAELELVTKEAKGHRTMAAIAASEGNESEAAQYAAQAGEAAQRAGEVTAEISRLEEKIRVESASTHSAERDDHGDVSVTAYLVVGLERAARDNGTGPARLGQLCDELLVGWRFHPDCEDLAWSCEALIPLTSGGHARLPLAGTIRNVRTRTGRSLANTATVVRYLFEEGRDLTDVAAVLEVDRKGLLTRRVMPFLVNHGVSARGAKCALVDHPLSTVRRDIYSHLQAGPHPDPPANAYLRRLLGTYLDPDLTWGDAAVPDDTSWIQNAVRLLTADTGTRKQGLPVLDIALALGRSEDDVRELVKPQRRAAGFTRPRYLVYADKAKTRVKAVGCPHDRCKGRRYADHVALLPEVAASGYGVICRHCRRTPATHGEWPITQFPPAYLSSWTNRGPGGSLRVEGQTVPVGARVRTPL